MHGDFLNKTSAVSVGEGLFPVALRGSGSSIPNGIAIKFPAITTERKSGWHLWSAVHARMAIKVESKPRLGEMGSFIAVGIIYIFIAGMHSCAQSGLGT